MIKDGSLTTSSNSNFRNWTQTVETVLMDSNDLPITVLWNMVNEPARNCEGIGTEVNKRKVAL